MTPLGLGCLNCTISKRQWNAISQRKAIAFCLSLSIYKGYMKRVKILFLDIDGVLNCNSSSLCPLGVKDIDEDKLERLKEIIDRTSAKIMLISSWKEGWYGRSDKKDKQSDTANYLDMRFARVGLRISGKVLDLDYGGRGASILDYLGRLKKKGIEVTRFAILDDEMGDYGKMGLRMHLVKTSFLKGGLTKAKEESAIGLLS